MYGCSKGTVKIYTNVLLYFASEIYKANNISWNMSQALHVSSSTTHTLQIK